MGLEKFRKNKKKDKGEYNLSVVEIDLQRARRERIVKEKEANLLTIQLNNAKFLDSKPLLKKQWQPTVFKDGKVF